MTFRPLMRLASFAIGGMCAVRRLISATGSRGTSSAQKRTPDMSGTSAVAASLCVGDAVTRDRRRATRERERDRRQKADREPSPEHEISPNTHIPNISAGSVLRCTYGRRNGRKVALRPQFTTGERRWRDQHGSAREIGRRHRKPARLNGRYGVAVCRLHKLRMTAPIEGAHRQWRRRNDAANPPAAYGVRNGRDWPSGF